MQQFLKFSLNILLTITFLAVMIVFITTVKCRVECIEVLAVQIILNDSQSFAEALEMNDFPCS